MDQRLCISLVVGYQYLENGLSNVLDRYLKFFNNPARYDSRTSKTPRYEQSKYRYFKDLGLEVDLQFLNPQKMQIGTVNLNKNADSWSLTLENYINFSSKEGDLGRISG